MDIRWLEDFLALAELRNFTRAAEYRNVSQAAFSRRIQSLEHWLGAKVVIKGVTPVRLTDAGKELRDTAEFAVGRLLETRSSIRAQQFDVMSRIRIAMPNVLARSEFRQVLGIIGESSPASFSVTVGNTAEVIQRYLARDADILFAHDCPSAPPPESLEGHDRLVIRRDRFAPYAVNDPAKREKFGFPGTAQAPFPLVAYDHRAYFARLFEQVLERAEILPSYRLKVQCDMSDVLKEIIVAGHGVGWLPESAVDTASAQIISPIGSPDWWLDLDICAFRPKSAVSPEIDTLWRALEQMALSS